MSVAWSFHFGCFHCGSSCRMIANGHPSLNRSSAIVECENKECAATFQLMVVAGALKSPREWRGSSGCGTTSGYRAHYKAGEKPCEECRAAHLAAKREQRAAKAGRVLQSVDAL